MLLVATCLGKIRGGASLCPGLASSSAVHAEGAVAIAFTVAPHSGHIPLVFPVRSYPHARQRPALDRTARRSHDSSHANGTSKTAGSISSHMGNVTAQ